MTFFVAQLYWKLSLAQNKNDKGPVNPGAFSHYIGNPAKKIAQL